MAAIEYLYDNSIEIKNKITAALNAAMLLISETNRLKIEDPITINGYVLSHPLGALLVVDSGDVFKDNDHSREVVMMDRDCFIDVVMVIRKFQDSSKRSPVEWKEWVLDTVGGLAVVSMRADKQVRPVTAKILEEDNGIWVYSLTFKAPTKFIDQTPD